MSITHFSQSTGRLSSSCSAWKTPAVDGEAELLSRLRTGDEQAWEMIVSRHAGRLLAVAHRFLGSEDESAQAVQEAFCSAIRAIGGFESTSTLSTWLHRRVVNTCLTKLRFRSRREAISIDQLLPAFDAAGHLAQPMTRSGEQSLSCMEEAQARDKVRVCIDLLPDDHRLVLLLHDMEELDTEETAEVLGISVPTVKTRLHRARQALRTLLDLNFIGPH
jgi:RNA polymerase sigma-70 factor (ECF subfamily)